MSHNLGYIRFSQQGNSFHASYNHKVRMINHVDVDRENVIVAHDHAPLGLFAWVKATASTHASVQTHVHRTEADDDAWTGGGCRSY